MGTCSSVHKPRSFASSPSSKPKPLKEGNAVEMAGNGPSLKSSSFGSKEELFFDSKEWLDSDCDDDFFSVNGDFTPSKRSTPNHQISTITSQPVRSLSFDSKPEPSPNGRKKLSDLFHETSQLNDSSEKLEVNGQFVNGRSKSDQPRENGNSVSNLTPSRGLKYKKKVAQCCLPSLRPSSSINDRRQKASPVH